MRRIVGGGQGSPVLLLPRLHHLAEVSENRGEASNSSYNGPCFCIETWMNKPGSGSAGSSNGVVAAAIVQVP
jgi:hypothetical protein